VADLLVAGSVAIDSLEGDYGHAEAIGGSATYFSLAASLFMPVGIVAPVGGDGIERLRATLGSRPLDLTHLDLVEAPTYRWHAHGAGGRNRDLGSLDSIYDAWSPNPPPGFAGWAFVGSMRPDRQAEAATRLPGARLLASDAMLSYAQHLPAALPVLLQTVGWFFGTEEEFHAIEPGFDPQRFRAHWNLAGVVVKFGPGGVTAHTEHGSEHVGAVRTREVVDTTGAGDALAGGMLARWLMSGAQPDGLRDALRWGTACASIAIGSIGSGGIAAATMEDVGGRLRDVPD
jgi:sugar/nucleoside kinase (ribokinase family)